MIGKTFVEWPGTELALAGELIRRGSSNCIPLGLRFWPSFNGRSVPGHAGTLHICPAWDIGHGDDADRDSDRVASVGSRDTTVGSQHLFRPGATRPSRSGPMQ